jgi:modification methylase
MSEFPALAPTGEEPSPHTPAIGPGCAEAAINGQVADRDAAFSGASRCPGVTGGHDRHSHTAIDPTARVAMDADRSPTFHEAEVRPRAWLESQYESDREWPTTLAFSARGSALPTESVWSELRSPDRAQTESLLDFDSRALSVISERAISRYSEPGEIVFDPQCSTPIIVGEAAQQGRQAIGIVEDTQSATSIARLLNMESAGRARFRTIESAISQPVHRGRQEAIPTKAFASLAIITARAALPRCPDRNCGYDLHRSEPAPHREFFSSLRDCLNALRPNGIVIVYAPRRRMGGELVDIPGMTVAALRKVGFTPIDRLAVAVPLPHGNQSLHCSDDGRFTTRFALGRRGPSLHQRIHEDLIVARVSQ